MKKTFSAHMIFIRKLDCGVLLRQLFFSFSFKNILGLLSRRRKITTQIALLSSPDCLKPKEEKECVVLVVKNSPANAGDTGDANLIPESGRFPGGGSLQYSCLENPMDRGAWSATVPEVTKNRT
ncbi:unnamed protein product [Rangifer tarandus platyrhynchus]|uniref:Uncharacterized protein n=1 Tax=Rangifer tarandus platyrhynchus TaxID=3082113 RepID=A0AC59ZWI0_RANTA